MKLSNTFTKTQKNRPANESANNAQLLIQAGYIHKELAGVYAYLPIGLRVLEKIKNIVREEMNSIGGQEVMMTALQPRELWEKTDRWDDKKVDNWFKTKLASGSELGVGLTHEEPVVDMLLDHISSYKDLPLFVYQIQSKFRNELRAKSGLLRGREFMMKDMYSFALNQQQHDELYEKAALAYNRVYQRLGLGDITFRVKADGGIFTDRFSDEFQTVSPIGEDTLFKVPSTGEFYNEEVAPAQAPATRQDDEGETPMEEVEGKGIIGVEELAKFLKIPVEQTTKTMLFQTDDGRIIAAAVRGGYEVNEIKLRKIVNAKSLKLAGEDTVKKVTGAEVGYAGLIGLPGSVEIVVDESCANRINFEMGANKTDSHNINVNWGRDLPEPGSFVDIKIAQKGDLYPDTGEVYETMRAVEVGNIFPLETKYSDALGLFYNDEHGKQQSIIMGCYGIGISRLMGVIAEHFADEKGLIWPEIIAPYKVHLVSIQANDQAEELYNILINAGIEVLYDDRDVRAGEKFADADLIGIPNRVVVSKRSVDAGEHELTLRSTGETKNLKIDELIEALS